MSATGGTQNTAAPDAAAVVRVYKPANPAAGAQLAFTATEQFELDALFFNFATSAVVTNRFINVQVRDGTGAILWADQPITQTASQTLSYSYYNGPGGQGTGNAPLQCSMPRLILPVGFQIVTAINAFDPADQLSAVAITGRIA